MKVIKRFRDKNTKKLYNIGDTYDGTKKRAEEVAAKGFIDLGVKSPVEVETEVVLSDGKVETATTTEVEVEKPKKATAKKKASTKKEDK